MKHSYLLARLFTLLIFQVAALTVILPGGWLNPIASYAQGAVGYDFESGDLGDWLTQGQVSIVSNSIDPQTINTMQAVAQGNYSVRIGDEIAWADAGDQVSSIQREVVVPSTGTPVLQFSYAVVANDPPSHDLIDKPNFRLEIVDLTTGETLPVSDFKYSSQTSGDWYLGAPPGNLGFSQSSFSTVSGDRWVFIPWKHEKVDLSGRGGHQLRISFLLSDCNPQAHAAYGYFDNIHVGDEVALPALPPLAGQPVPAGIPPDPGLLAPVMKPVEQWKIWPWCLLPLLLLPLLLVWYLLSRGNVTGYDPSKHTGDSKGPRPPTSPTSGPSGTTNSID